MEPPEFADVVCKERKKRKVRGGGEERKRERISKIISLKNWNDEIVIK